MSSVSKLKKLSTLDLKVVVKALLPISNKWYDLGLEFDIGVDTLDNIKSSCENNVERLRECLKIFLKQINPTPTWEVIVKALSEPTIGHPQLAKELEEKYLQKDQEKAGPTPSEGDTIKELQELVKKQSEHISRLLAMQNVKDTMNIVSSQSPDDLEVFKRATMTITNKAVVFDWKEGGIRLTVPEGALPKDLSNIKLDVKVTLTGRYNSVSENVEFASPVYWIEPTPSVKFVKPIWVEIQHCADMQKSTDMNFVIRKRPTEANMDLQHKFEMLPGGEFTRLSCYGKIALQEFSGIAIVLPKGGRHRYIGQLWYKDTTWQDQQEEWSIMFTIFMDLDVLTSVIGTRFADFVKGTTIPLKFDGLQIMLDVPPAGKFDKGEWKLYPVQPPVITLADVDMFNSPSGKLVPSCTLKCVHPRTRTIRASPYELVTYEGLIMEQPYVYQKPSAKPKFIVDIIGASAPNDYIVIELAPRGIASKLLHQNHLHEIVQRQYWSSITYKALKQEYCEILYEVVDASDPEARSYRYRQYRYYGRDSGEASVLIEGPQQDITFLSEEIILEVPVTENGWEISALNYPSIRAGNNRGGVIHLIAKYVKKHKSHQPPPPLEAVIFISGAAAPQNFIKLFYDYNMMVKKKKRTLESKNESKMLWQQSQMPGPLTAEDDDHGEHGDDNDSQHLDPSIPSFMFDESTPVVLDVHDTVSKKDDVPTPNDSVVHSKVKYWESKFFDPMSGSKTPRKKHRSLEEGLPLKKTNSKSRNSMDTQSASQFSSVM